MNFDNSKNIISIISGGTGGHIFPALAILKKLRNYEIIFITDSRGYRHLKNDVLFMKLKNVEILKIPTISPFAKGIVSKLKFLYYFIYSFIKLLTFYFNNKPQIQIGFGGYVSVLPCIVGKMFFKIDYFIHEQNAVMGRANKVLEHFTSTTFMPFTKITPNRYLNKRVYSGTPIREEIYSLKTPKINTNRFNILIFGGSLGSEFFSKELVKSVINLNNKIKKDIFISHQITTSNLKSVKKKYNQNNILSDIRDFFPNIEKLYKSTDLLICRAGGSTIAEILHLKIPCIVFPLTNSLDNHQFFNSKIIENYKLGWVINENYFNNAHFTKLIESIILNKKLLKKIKNNFEKYSTKKNYKTNFQSSVEIITNILITHISASEDKK